MPNLIHENDFIQIKKFNPWKSISLCCVIAIVQVSSFVIFLTSTEAFSTNEYAIYFYRVWTILNLLFPLLLAFFMVFFNKKIVVLPLKTLFLALSCLGVTYTLGLYLSMAIYSYYKDYPVTEYDIYMPLACGFSYFVIFSSIVLPIARYKAGKSKL